MVSTGPEMTLTRLPRPFIVSVITDRSPAAGVAAIRTSALEGAHAFEINLPLYPAASPNDLASLFAATDRPVYTTCRRAAFMTVYGIPRADLPEWSDDERMDRQLAAVGQGSAAIDIEMDTFDPRPAPSAGLSDHEAASVGPACELTDDPAAIRRQRDVASAARNAGAEVAFSCHTGRPQTVDGLLAIAMSAVDRGADLLKIVTPCATTAHLFDVLEATRRMARGLPIPFVLVGSGKAGDISRLIGVNFGCSWVIAQPALTAGGFHAQPLVAHAREILRLMPWRAPAGEVA
jgi:hypothetical protein